MIFKRGVPCFGAEAGLFFFLFLVYNNTGYNNTSFNPSSVFIDAHVRKFTMLKEKKAIVLM